MGKREARWALLSDGLATAAVVFLPWSTSLTGVAIAAWLLVLLPRLDLEAVRRELLTPAGGLPILLWLTAAIGMFWSHASWGERLAGLGGFHKLSCIPILIAQFRNTSRGHWVVLGFLGSATSVLALSWLLFFFPSIPWHGRSGVPGIPTKDYIFQSEMFALCALGLSIFVPKLWHSHRRVFSLALTMIIGAFLANIAFVATGRTTLVAMTVLLPVLGIRFVGWKGGFAGTMVAVVLAAGMWLYSPYIRDRMVRTMDEIQIYRASGELSSTGLHLEFWKKSVELLAEAPIAGHGTGAIRQKFLDLARGKVGSAAVITDNPHNQIFAVGIQLGTIGVLVLLTMWWAHLRLFRDRNLISTLGLIIVVQNIVGSLFNSHLFDFTQGWLYVFGVGVTAGWVYCLETRNPRVNSG